MNHFIAMLPYSGIPSKAVASALPIRSPPA